MRKFYFFVIAVSAFLFACSEFRDLELPKSLSVKASAKFEVPVGDATFSVREKAGVEKLTDVLLDNDAGNVSVYEYSPNGTGESANNDVLQFVFNYTLKEISLSLPDTSLIPDDPPDDFSLSLPVSNLLRSGAPFIDTIETGLNFSTLLGDLFKGDSQNLIEDIDFYGLEGYIFISKPTKNEELSKLGLEGQVYASYKDASGNSVRVDLLDSDSSDSDLNGRLNMINPSPTLDEAANDDKIIVTTEVFAESNYSKKIKDGVITGLINAHPDALSLTYSLKFATDSGSITVDKEVAEILKSGDLKISINLALVIPLQIIFNDRSDGTPDDKTIVIDDAVALFKSSDDDDEDEDEDVFNRDSADDNDKWSKYAAALKKLELDYTVANNLLIKKEDKTDLNLGIYLYSIDENGAVSSWFNQKELESESGAHILDLREESQSIFENYPFIPKVRLEIPADGSTNLIVPRTAAYGINGLFRIEFDENTPIEIWNKDDKD